MGYIMELEGRLTVYQPRLELSAKLRRLLARARPVPPHPGSTAGDAPSLTSPAVLSGPLTIVMSFLDARSAVRMGATCRALLTNAARAWDDAFGSDPDPEPVRLIPGVSTSIEELRIDDEDGAMSLCEEGDDEPAVVDRSSMRLAHGDAAWDESTKRLLVDLAHLRVDRLDSTLPYGPSWSNHSENRRLADTEDMAHCVAFMPRTWTLKVHGSNKWYFIIQDVAWLVRWLIKRGYRVRGLLFFSGERHYEDLGFVEWGRRFVLDVEAYVWDGGSANHTMPRLMQRVIVPNDVFRDFANSEANKTLAWHTWMQSRVVREMACFTGRPPSSRWFWEEDPDPNKGTREEWCKTRWEYADGFIGPRRPVVRIATTNFSKCAGSRVRCTCCLPPTAPRPSSRSCTASLRTATRSRRGLKRSSAKPA